MAESKEASGSVDTMSITKNGPVTWYYRDSVWNHKVYLQLKDDLNCYVQRHDFTRVAFADSWRDVDIKRAIDEYVESHTNEVIDSDSGERSILFKIGSISLINCMRDKNAADPAYSRLIKFAVGAYTFVITPWMIYRGKIMKILGTKEKILQVGVCNGALLAKISTPPNFDLGSLEPGQEIRFLCNGFTDVEPPYVMDGCFLEVMKL